MDKTELDKELRLLHKEYQRIQKMMIGIEPIKNLQRWWFVQMIYNEWQRLKKKRRNPFWISIAEKLSTPEAKKKLQDLFNIKTSIDG